MEYCKCRFWIYGILFWAVFQVTGTPIILKLIRELSAQVHRICIGCYAMDVSKMDRMLDHELLQTTLNIQCLLRSNSKLADEADASGQTPLMAAAFAGFDTIVALLLSHGAAVDRVDARGKSAIDYVSLALSPRDPFSYAIAQAQKSFYRWGTHRQCVCLISAARCLDSPERAIGLRV